MMNTVFQYLEKFKGLPTYQFERRIDAFILPYLETIFNQIYETHDFILIYPEFPLCPLKEKTSKLDKTSLRSVYADYILWSKDLDNTVFLVEFKTDKESVLQGQFQTYILNCREGWISLFQRYLEKAKHAADNGGPWRKYCYGLDYFYDIAPELTGRSHGFYLSRFYTAKRGSGIAQYLKSISLDFKSKFKTKLIYIAPSTSIKTLNVIGSNYKEVYDPGISLSQLADYTEEPLTSLLRKIDDPDKYFNKLDEPKPKPVVC